MKIAVIFTNIKRLLYLIALITLVFMCIGIYPYIFLPITIGCIMVGILLSAFFTQKLGVPSNVVDSEKIIYVPDIQNEIKIIEIQKGIWQIMNNKYNTIFDMRNWVKRKRYIADIITTYLILATYNPSSQAAYSLPYGKQKYIYENLEILFISKKTKRRIIVKKHFFVKSLHNRIRFRLCLKGVKGSARKYKNTKHYVIEMKDIYIFKKN